MKTKIITGNCPNQKNPQKKSTLKIDYINTGRALENGRLHFVKDHFECDNTDCNINSCPLYEQAPQYI